MEPIAVAVNACRFLSAEEVATAVEAHVERGQRHDSGEVAAGASTIPDTYSSTCVWRLSTPGSPPADPQRPLSGASYVILNVMQWPRGSGRAHQFVDDFRAAARDGTIEHQPVALKIADEALWWGDGVAVRKGDRSFGISVHLVGGRARERGIEEALAKRIAPRL
jgi:hypothetical protein